jgi:Tfp pilus assembly protein PilP
LLVVVGCRREVPPEERLAEARQEMEETRQEARAEMERIRQRAAERTAEAQREMVEQLAQQQRRIEQAEQRWQAEQRAYAEYFQQRTGATVATLDSAGAVQGRIVSRGPEGFVVRDEHGRVYELSTDARTRVTQNEQPVSLEMYTEGTQVRASFIVTEEDEFLAREVEILPVAPPPPAPTPGPTR